MSVKLMHVERAAREEGVSLKRHELLRFNGPIDFRQFDVPDDIEDDDKYTVDEREAIMHRNAQENRTKQAFKDLTDINKIVQRHQIPMATSHAVRFPEEYYADFENMDLLDAFRKIERINVAFDDLPSEVRKDFHNDPFAFAAFVTDPVNKGRLAELLPKLAEPDKYFPNPSSRGGQGAGAATAPQAAPGAAGNSGSSTSSDSGDSGASDGGSGGDASSST